MSHNVGSNPEQIGLALHDLGHRFGTRTVFKDIRLELCAGQVGVIAGSNGSGKSTLLKIVAGLLTPHSGDATIQIDGRTLDATERRRFLGYVSPDLTLYRELTGVENLEFFARLRGITPSRAFLKALLEQVGLLGRGSDAVSGYSSGMRQRLKYAFALLGAPRILLLDEPTANLDARGVEMVERVVATHRANGGLMLVATNEPREEEWGDIQVRLNPSV